MAASLKEKKKLQKTEFAVLASFIPTTAIFITLIIIKTFLSFYFQNNFDFICNSWKYPLLLCYYRLKRSESLNFNMPVSSCTAVTMFLAPEDIFYCEHFHFIYYHCQLQSHNPLRFCAVDRTDKNLQNGVKGPGGVGNQFV